MLSLSLVLLISYAPVDHLSSSRHRNAQQYLFTWHLPSRSSHMFASTSSWPGKSRNTLALSALRCPRRIQSKFDKMIFEISRWIFQKLCMKRYYSLASRPLSFVTSVSENFMSYNRWWRTRKMCTAAKIFSMMDDNIGRLYRFKNTLYGTEHKTVHAPRPKRCFPHKPRGNKSQVPESKTGRNIHKRYHCNSET